MTNLIEVNIAEVLTPELINLNLKGTNKDEVFKEMVQMLKDAGKIESFDEFIADVYLREEEGVTGIGNHIAIPHGKSDTVLATSVVVGRADHDIEWETIDDEPVRLVIMLAIKSFDKTVHIRLLSKIATSLCDNAVVERLLKAKDALEVIELFSEKKGD